MKRYSAKSKVNRNAAVGLGAYLLVLGLGLALYGLIDARGYEPRGLKPETTSASTALDVSSLAPCPGEYGPATRDPQAACVWDATTRGSNPVQGADIRWLVYLPSCPVATVQNRALVVCVPLDHWGE
jgi:hypothetical protein